MVVRSVQSDLVNYRLATIVVKVARLCGAEKYRLTNKGKKTINGKKGEVS